MRVRVSCVVLGCALALATARAEPPPWAAGVSDAQKAQAQASLDLGNRQFVERDYAAALVTYRAAAAIWDHPAIRFNIVRCLIQLDRPLEAYDNLKRTLAYGAAPLEEAVYAEALAYEKLLAKQIGELEVRCEQPGARLTLDGKPLALACPGAVVQRVVPGPHQVVGQLDGFLTQTLDVDVVGGARRSAAIALVSLSEVNVMQRRWRARTPWLVFGGGLAVVGIGALINVKAASDMSDFEGRVNGECGGRGCEGAERDALLETKRAAVFENRLGIAVLATGAAATITGAVMLYMNRPRSRYAERIQPVAVRGGAGVAIGGRF